MLNYSVAELRLISSCDGASSSSDEQAVKDTIENKAKRIAIKEKCNFFISCARYADS